MALADPRDHGYAESGTLHDGFDKENSCPNTVEKLRQALIDELKEWDSEQCSPFGKVRMG